MKDPLAAGVREGPVDPDVDALIIANVYLHKVVGSSHNLKNRAFFKLSWKMELFQQKFEVAKETYYTKCPSLPDEKYLDPVGHRPS